MFSAIRSWFASRSISRRAAMLGLGAAMLCAAVLGGTHAQTASAYPYYTTYPYSYSYGYNGWPAYNQYEYTWPYNNNYLGYGYGGWPWGYSAYSYQNPYVFSNGYSVGYSYPYSYGGYIIP